VPQPKVYHIEVTRQEKELFQEWLEEKQNQLASQQELIETQLELIKSLIKKMSAHSDNMAALIDADKIPVDNPNPKWTAKSLKILKEHRGKWMDSSEVVDIVMSNDDLSASLPRVEVMRGVSSRLNQLAKREQAEKKTIEGRIHYRYLKD